MINRPRVTDGFHYIIVLNCSLSCYSCGKIQKTHHRWWNLWKTSKL